MEFTKISLASITLRKVANIFVVIGLLTCSGLFGQKVLMKFMAKDTSYKRLGEHS